MTTKKTTTKKKSVWEVLSRIDCSQYVEKKGMFNYLSWSWAWGILKEHYPKAKFKYIKTQDGKTAFKDEEGYAFVRVAVTVEDETVEEDLAVMNNTNQDIKNPKPTQINTSLKRCLVKAMAFHGLGINVYAGEDLLMFDEDNQEEKSETKVASKPKTAPKPKPESVSSKTAPANDRQKTEIRALFQGKNTAQQTKLRKDLLEQAQIKLPKNLSAVMYTLNDIDHLLTEAGAARFLNEPTF